MKIGDAHLNDHDLLLRLRNGEKLAFEKIYDAHWQFIYTSTFRMLRHEDDSLDICQNIFMSLWENRDIIRLETNLRAYLFGAVKYKVANLIRRGRSRLIFTDDTSIFEIPQNENQEIEVKELASYISHLIDKLPTRCKEVFLLSRRDQLTHRQIAQKLGISEKTVDDHITRALKQLRTPLHKLAMLMVSLF